MHGCAIHHLFLFIDLLLVLVHQSLKRGQAALDHIGTDAGTQTAEGGNTEAVTGSHEQVQLCATPEVICFPGTGGVLDDGVRYGLNQICLGVQ